MDGPADGALTNKDKIEETWEITGASSVSL